MNDNDNNDDVYNDDTFYRSQRALSSDYTMRPAHVAFWCSRRQGLITPPTTPPGCMMDLVDVDDMDDMDVDPPVTSSTTLLATHNLSTSHPPSHPTSHPTSHPPTIPADAYPHIVDAILAYAPHDALATLRTVCRSWRDRADARLLTHVILQDNYVPALPAGGPIRTNWFTFPVHTLDLVDLDLASPRPLPPKVHILRVRNIARWSTLSLPRSNTLVIKGLISDGGFGPTLQTWAPYLSRTTRLVVHYNPKEPELGAWGIIGGSIRQSLGLSSLSSFSLQEIVFVFTDAADAIELSFLGPLIMLCLQLGWHAGKPAQVRMTLVNVLPRLAAGVEAGETLTGETEDVHALFLRAAGFGSAPDDQLKRDFGHYFDFVTFDQYRQRLGDEQFELEMGMPRRVGPPQLLQPIPPRDEKMVRFTRIQ
ncbi:hypothetical protein CcaverHIS002_0300730 [Cutaneotrichosporon cavernicola]|uniref:F-box domain-containing protein n=1 Tax=Cutaneotrichosporon cavernicola TaxID=279322 RepID=A0AA48IBZ4_9TREE|nr:uncharacterized protein CcaverHIS019_0300720 [Cutaneotrichosporon cavernicola]BEI82205.1 hypothetical protein CcaverHIS002_0300730 [Cutaneotrichosporon cavernicola]BEI90002.1 hypothetical protein CcaverHIS019_0300720 [Cutaneotrichosporon cavernicola]BEI97774.1 hypothetical protein CcaverHIS631_0300730 [Cutaneotrichosporon cavernicola]BEJ05552.1 hypothetical protein CcaverHIS641_0300740 [Cutaneotrichosporon cavernicola]